MTVFCHICRRMFLEIQMNKKTSTKADPTFVSLTFYSKNVDLNYTPFSSAKQ